MTAAENCGDDGPLEISSTPIVLYRVVVCAWSAFVTMSYARKRCKSIVGTDPRVATARLAWGLGGVIAAMNFVVAAYLPTSEFAENLAEEAVYAVLMGTMGAAGCAFMVHMAVMWSLPSLLDNKSVQKTQKWGRILSVFGKFGSGWSSRVAVVILFLCCCGWFAAVRLRC